MIGAPFTDIRVELFDLSLLELYEVPGLIAIHLHPAAAGPEVELVFGTPEEDEPAEEEFLRDEVKRITGKTVLAYRRREMT